MPIPDLTGNAILDALSGAFRQISMEPFIRPDRRWVQLRFKRLRATYRIDDKGAAHWLPHYSDIIPGVDSEGVQMLATAADAWYQWEMQQKEGAPHE